MLLFLSVLVFEILDIPLFVYLSFAACKAEVIKEPKKE